jgi:hypothetical protein
MDITPAAYDAARTAARWKLKQTVGDLISPSIADQIADVAAEKAVSMSAADLITKPHQPGYGGPVSWLVYNAMHLRALRAENMLRSMGVTDDQLKVLESDQ